MKITVIGTGYVGLVVGTCFAESGNQVICADIDENKIGMLQNGEIPIYEPGLEELIRRNVEEQRLSFTTEIEAAVKAATVIFIAVGTPQGDDGSADLGYVLAVAASIGKYMDGYRLIVDKSTVPVGSSGISSTATKFSTCGRHEAATSLRSSPDTTAAGSSASRR